MDWAQFANGVAAICGFVVLQVAFLVLLDHRSLLHRAVHTAASTLLLWYGTINLLLAFGVWNPEPIDVIPFFRLAFGPTITALSLWLLVLIHRVEHFDIADQIEVVEASDIDRQVHDLIDEAPT